MIEKPLVLFVVTEDWYFVSHRLALAERIKAAGYRVAVATRFTQYRERIEAAGLQCVPIRLRRRVGLPWEELLAIAELRRLYRQMQPAVVHLVALKPILSGGVSAFTLRGQASVSAIAGLGSLFSSKKWRARLGRFAVTIALRLLLGRSRAWVIVQNPEDEATLRRLRIGAPERIRLIRGAGVDLKAFSPSLDASDQRVVLYAGRMLREKGVEDFVAASRWLRERRANIVFRLAGAPDPDNPTSLSESDLHAWEGEGLVEWVGPRDDMPSVLAGASIVCLPTTYGEGVPKILIEAAASGRPIIATDWPGCREIVIPGVNGVLVPPRDPVALAREIEHLISDRRKRLEMGAAGRKLVETDFSIDSVSAATLSLYGEAQSSV